MFDRPACVRMFVAVDARVDLAALTALMALLQQALNDRPASLDAPLSGVSILSRDDNRGELHAVPDKAKIGTPRRAAADRPVRRRTNTEDRQRARLVRAAGGHTSGIDRTDDAVAPGACQQEPDRLDDGGRS